MRSGSDNQVLQRGYLIAEILLVLGLSLGRSGVYAVVDFLADLTSGVPLSQQTTTLNAFEQSLEQHRPHSGECRQLGT